MFVLGASAAGLWLPESGLVTLPRRMVLELSGSCSFCGKMVTEVAGLAGVRGRLVRICNECIGLCCDILGEEVELDPRESLAPSARAAAELDGRMEELDDVLERLGKSLEELAAEFGQTYVPPPCPTVHMPPLACSFCDTAQKDTRKLIAGPTVYVCDTCVGDGAAILSAQLRA